MKCHKSTLVNFHLVALLIIPQLLNARVIEEITVTAQKRQQNLQDIPMSITAISAREMIGLEYSDSGDIASHIPGLSWGGTANKSRPQIFMRGVGNSDFSAAANSPVAIYQDGVFQGNSFGLGALLMDVERVEVLRGPQGTLWGKNTTAGLLNFVPNKAEVGAETNGHVSASYGEFDDLDVEGAIGIPLGDQVAARIAVNHNSNGGVFDAVGPVFVDDGIGGWDWTAVRGNFEFEPNEDLSISATITYSDLDGELKPAKSLGNFDPLNPFNFFTFSGNPCSLNPGRLGTGCSDIEGFVSPVDIHDVAPEARSREEVENVSADLQVQYKIGKYTLTSITAYNSSERLAFDDTDNSPSGLLNASFEDDYSSISQELHFASDPSQRLNWIAGIYYFSDELDLYFQSLISFFGGLGEASTFGTESETFAIFGDFNYSVTDRLIFSGGIRWTNDEREGSGRNWFHFATRATFNPLATAMATEAFIPVPMFQADVFSRIEDDWQELSGRASLTYSLTDNVTLWGTFSRGFKGGDINSGANDPGEFNISDPEFVNSFEAGIKGLVLNDALQFNISGYYYEYDDKQVFTEVTGLTGTQLVLSNAGQLTISGFDGELTWLPSERLAISSGIAYIDSEFDSFLSPATGVDLAGNTTAYTPELSFDVIARYEWPLPNGDRISIQGDAVFTDDVFFTNDNDPRVGQDSYWLLGGNIGYTTADDKWDLRIWVKNLTDEEYFTGGFDFTFLGPNIQFPGDPRMVGGTVSYNF